MSEQNHEERIADLEHTVKKLDHDLKQSEAKAKDFWKFHLKVLAGLTVQILGGIGCIKNEVLAFERAAASLLPEPERQKLLDRVSKLETDAEKSELLIAEAKKALGLDGSDGGPPPPAPGS